MCFPFFITGITYQYGTLSNPAVLYGVVGGGYFDYFTVFFLRIGPKKLKSY